MMGRSPFILTTVPAPFLPDRSRKRTRDRLGLLEAARHLAILVSMLEQRNPLPSAQHTAPILSNAHSGQMRGRGEDPDPSPHHRHGRSTEPRNMRNVQDGRLKARPLPPHHPETALGSARHASPSLDGRPLAARRGRPIAAFQPPRARSSALRSRSRRSSNVASDISLGCVLPSISARATRTRS